MWHPRSETIHFSSQSTALTSYSAIVLEVKRAMSEYHNQWFARMALVALGKNTVSVPTLLAPKSSPSQDRVPSRGRALRLWGLGMACWGLNHEVGQEAANLPHRVIDPHVE